MSDQTKDIICCDNCDDEIDPSRYVEVDGWIRIQRKAISWAYQLKASTKIGEDPINDDQLDFCDQNCFSNYVENCI